MIEKLDTNDFRPIIIIDKINEVIDKINERDDGEETTEEAKVDSLVEDAEPSNVNETND